MSIRYIREQTKIIAALERDAAISGASGGSKMTFMTQEIIEETILRVNAPGINIVRGEFPPLPMADEATCAICDVRSICGYSKSLK